MIPHAHILSFVLLLCNTLASFGQTGDVMPCDSLICDTIAFDPKTVASDRATAVFAPAKGSKYAFDAYSSKYAESLLFSEKYEELRTYGSEAYPVPFKLIPAGTTDVVQVTITPAALPEGLEMKAIDPDRIIFRTANGTEYMGKMVTGDGVTGGQDNQSKIENRKSKIVIELTLPAAKVNGGYELYALHPVYAANTRGYEYDMLGKLTVLSYNMETPRVTLVAVNGNTIDRGAVKAYLDKVYLPVGINWQVGQAAFDYEIPKDSLDVTGSGMFSRYTPAMKRMNAAFMQRSDYDPSTLYIFVLQRASQDNTSGDMPRGCQFGYIFTGAIADARGLPQSEIIGRTIAHELGHGMFKLKHTFDSEYRIAQASTENLMDYNWGTDFVKHQWDAIHAPGLVIGMFERDEDGMMLLINLMPDYFGQKVVTPSGQQQRISINAIAILNNEDQTVAFMMPDEKIFYWIDSKTATGYFQEGGYSNKFSYQYYVEDKYNRKSEPITWGMYLATGDIGDFAFQLVASPIGTAKGMAAGIWKIVTLDFSIEKTWDKIINTDITDVSYVATMIAVGYVSSPGAKGVLGTEDFSRFGQFIKSNFQLFRDSKIAWPKVLELFRKEVEVVSKGKSLVKNVITKRVIDVVKKYDKRVGDIIEYPKYNNVALGKDMNGSLKALGEEVGANVWTKETHNVFTSMYNLPDSWSFEKSMTSVLNETVGKNQGKILFDLSGVKIEKAITGGLKHDPILVLDGLVTELELQLILRNKNWFENVIFHEAGIIISQKEILAKGIKFIEQ